MNPETEIEKIKSNCALERTTIALMKEKIDILDTNMELVLKKLETLNEKMDKRYANKWVEKVVATFLLILATSALYIIMDHVRLPR